MGRSLSLRLSDHNEKEKHICLNPEHKFPVFWFGVNIHPYQQICVSAEPLLEIGPQDRLSTIQIHSAWFSCRAALLGVFMLNSRIHVGTLGCFIYLHDSRVECLLKMPWYIYLGTLQFIASYVCTYSLDIRGWCEFWVPQKEVSCSGRIGPHLRAVVKPGTFPLQRQYKTSPWDQKPWRVHLDELVSWPPNSSVDKWTNSPAQRLCVFNDSARDYACMRGSATTSSSLLQSMKHTTQLPLRLQMFAYMYVEVRG